MAAFLDNCKFTPTAGGTADWTYSAAVTGYQSPSAAGVANGVKYKYFAVSADLTQWEIGEGAYNTSTSVLPRTTVLYNSSGTGTASGQSGAGSKISFSAAPNVSVVGLAEDLVSIEVANAFTATQQNQAQKNLGVPAIMRSYLAGLTLSTAGSSATFSIAAGIAADATAADVMTLSASISKTTLAWASGSGNGGLDTGTIAASTWYHAYLIKDVTTQAVDVLISVSASAPTMPGGYTLKRRIGSIKTNGSSQWILFHQNGDEFLWDAALQDVTGSANLGTSALLSTLTVPTGVEVNAIIAAAAGIGGSSVTVAITSPDAADAAPSGQYAEIVSASGAFASCQVNVRTNTSAQIRSRSSLANTNYFVLTRGWIDRRGRDN
ncbi:hypothetical protein [Bradyrhizobium sp.]|uniref:hypothetical protein n=1 Tax=Bradyrhizobium sp. TaxID=376 RepID=UPI00262AC4B8|nr:hypothetical protein [Bradyrhizobium sp.]